MRRFLILAVGLLLGLAATSTATAQWAVGDTLTTIQRPLLNIPAIVTPGTNLDIKCVAPLGTTGWTAHLVRDGLDVPLAVTDAYYNSYATWWTVSVDIPEVPVYDLYDLRVTADGGIDDTSWHAVKVIPAFREDFSFIQITDTHLPTYLYYDEPGAATDSTNVVHLRDITDDVNLINPEFVVITGDFIHEGELEDYLDRRYYSRAQRQLREFEVPVYLTAGNHDVGGWNDTPPPDGTARRNWWRFFGWQRLDDPPVNVPYRTQNYSWDYGPVHFIGLEAYDNYDSWRYTYYGAESFTSPQLDWLGLDLAAHQASEAAVLFHHYDFANELNLSALGIDMALWGHIHQDVDDFSHPFDIATDNAGSYDSPFRLVRWQDGQLAPRPTLAAGGGGNTLRAVYSPANDGAHDSVTATIYNGHPERFATGLLRVRMPSAPGYIVSGGTLSQVDDTGDVAVCYVDVDIPSGGNLTVTVEVDDAAPAGLPDAGRTRLVGAVPNPFNPRTEVRFELGEDRHCRLTAFDVRGREVAVLVDGDLPAGEHAVTWDARGDDGAALPSGVYFLGLRAGRYTETRKVTLIR